MRKHRHSPLMLTVAVLLVPFIAMRSCSRSHRPTPRPAKSSSDKEGSPMSFAPKPFALSSTAFTNGGEIATRYTCDGADLSPALTWDGAPAGTQSLALIADDPDAPMGTWTHWILWNIPAKATLLHEDAAKVELLDNGARQGMNDFKRIGYGGPCPPPGKPHRYFFKLYALDARLDLKAGAGRDQLELAMKPHVLAETQWMGTYKR
jgi:Raf kinase inhibitor-like YbhB/YbcL family protein